MTSWKIIFYVTTAFLLVEIVIYTWLGRGEEQRWNKKRPEQTEMQL